MWILSPSPSGIRSVTLTVCTLPPPCCSGPTAPSLMCAFMSDTWCKAFDIQRMVLVDSLNPQRDPTLSHEPYTRNPTTKPYTLHPTPYTLHPTPYTLHPTPCTKNPILILTFVLSSSTALNRMHYCRVAIIGDHYWILTFVLSSSTALNRMHYCRVAIIGDHYWILTFVLSSSTALNRMHYCRVAIIGDHYWILTFVLSSSTALL